MKSKLLLLFFLPIIAFAQTQLGENFTNPDENKIKPSLFGISTAISADGTIVAAGAPGVNETSFIRVFKYLNNKWQQLGSDIVNESVYESLGTSLSLSADGKTLAVGATRGGDLDEGHLRIYEFKDNKWQKTGQIVGDGTQFYLGYRIVLTPNAKFLATTSRITRTSSKYGVVKVYENISGTWTQKGTTLKGEFQYETLGSTIDLSDDGNTLAVGNSQKQAIQIFKFQNNDWSQIGETFTNLKQTSTTSLSVSLSSDGSRVAIGSSTGVSIYQNNADTWNLLGSMINYGSYSTLSSDGTKVVIGYSKKYKVRNYIFENNTWSQRGIEVVAGAESLAISADGDTFIAASDDVFPRVFSFNANLLSTEKILLENEVSLYPNPTKDSFKVQFSSNLELNEVSLFNLLGKKVVTSKSSFVDISSLSKGIYLVKITTNKGLISKKIIKK